MTWIEYAKLAALIGVQSASAGFGLAALGSGDWAMAAGSIVVFVNATAINLANMIRHGFKF